jgi:hypothetical protein
MRKSIFKRAGIAAILVVSISSCSSSNSSSDSSSDTVSKPAESSSSSSSPSSSRPVFKTGLELSIALNAAQVACVGYEQIPYGIEDEEFFGLSAVDSGKCKIDGKRIELDIWKNSKQVEGLLLLLKTAGCALGEALEEEKTTNEAALVDGGVWTISGVSETLAKEIAEKMDAKAVKLC